MSEPSVDAMETIAGDDTNQRRDDDDGLAKGTVLGRYVVLGRAGAGSMGVVYAAIDPELDRKLALKLLHRRSRGGTETMRARLLNEAKILARLAHPNVVAIHDVGTFEDHVWLAMEFIEGDTLREWSTKRRRSWREVLDVLIPAGRGLVAAHDAGLVHRDFKPENVMVGADGRVRVTDFGLATAPASASGSASSLTFPDTTSSTVDRGPIGTPAYMAPEQISERAHGPAADQFAFCVTLWEAINGERPFAGHDAASIVTAVLEHRLADSSDCAAMPSWLRSVLLRGIARDPTARFPAMAVLLDALERGQKRRRLVWIVGAIAATLAAPTIVWAMRAAEQRKLAHHCAEEGAAIESTWPGPAGSAREGVVAALRGVETGEDIAGRLMPWLDASAARWAEVREQTCRAHTIDGVWDDDMFARANACLEEQRVSLEALLEALTLADAQVVYQSVSLAAGLPLADACADVHELERMPLPDGVRTDTIRELRALEARGSTMHAATQYEAALHVAEQELEIAADVGLPRERVQALVGYGQTLDALARYEEAEAALTEAYAEAGRLGAMRPAAVAAIALIRVVGSRRGRSAEGLVWAQAAQFAIADLEDPPGLLTAQRLRFVADIHDDRGNYDEAIAAATESLAILEAAVGAEHPRAVLALSELGSNYERAGRLAEAQDVLARTLLLAERVLGREHPEFVVCLTHMGNVNVAMGRPREAQEYYERSLAILERVHGPRHPSVAATLMNLANARRQADDLEGLGPLFERAISIQEELMGKNHPQLAITLTNYGAWLADTGELARAKDVYARAVAIETASGATERPELAGTLHNLALIQTELGELDDAARLAERAMAILDRTLDREHPVRATVLLGLSDIERLRDHADQAVTAAEQALQIREHAKLSRREIAIAEFTLGRALWTTARGRAAALVERAHATLVAESATADAALTTKWLAEHRE